VGKYNALPTSRRILVHIAKSQKGNTIVTITGRPTETRTYQLVVRTVRTTEKAMMLCVYSVDDIDLTIPKTAWFPRSQITEAVFNPESADSDIITVKRWIMEQNGFLDNVGELKKELV
jgi:hypothetical protein